jgi:hypothetical protein
LIQQSKPHRDACELDDKTLEEIRIRAVEQVQGARALNW